MPRHSDHEDVQVLAHRLQMIELLEKHQHGKYWDLASPGSELELDDRAMSYFQSSHLVGHCLAVSLDALRATRFILQDPGSENSIRLPFIGHYAATRTAVESAALAVWLLQPDERDERIRRSLAARWDDIHHDNQLAMAFTEREKTDQKADVAKKNQLRKRNSVSMRAKKNHLRQVGKAAGIAEEAVNRGLPGFGPIVGEAASSIEITANHARGAWHMVSGLTHPSASRSMALSSIEFTPKGDGGVGSALFTADIATTNIAIESAFLFHVAALKLVGSRGDLPEVQFTFGPEVPLPPGFIRGRGHGVSRS